MEKKILAIIIFTFLLFFLSYTFRNRKLLSNTLIAGASLLTTLLFLEFAYRAFIKKKDATDKVHPFSLFITDSLLGYKNNQPTIYTLVNSFPGGDPVYNTSYTILNDTFNSGIHYNFRKGYKSYDTNKEVVFLGCSLTFGQGLADTQTLPYCYGAAANVSTINMACIGYGIHQVYQLFNSKFSHLDNHNRIFIYPFFYDHILRANGIYGWNKHGPFFDVQNDTLINRGPLYKFKKLKGDNWAFYASGFGSFKVIKDNLHQLAYRAAGKNLSDADYTRCFIMLQNMARKIAGSGGRLIILNWGQYNWFYKPLSDMKAKIEQNFDSLSRYGAMVIPVSSIIDLTDKPNFIPSDGHPSAVANQAIANWMSKNIKLEN
jgi:hypothetical protein